MINTFRHLEIMTKGVGAEGREWLPKRALATAMGFDFLVFRGTDGYTDCSFEKCGDWNAECGNLMGAVLDRHAWAGSHGF